MVDYTKIRSEYVKRQMNSSEDRTFIENLIYLERFVLGEIPGVYANQKFHHIANSYEYIGHYYAILHELDPKQLITILKRKTQTVQRVSEQEMKWKTESEKTWFEMKRKLRAEMG